MSLASPSQSAGPASPVINEIGTESSWDSLEYLVDKDSEIPVLTPKSSSSQQPYTFLHWVRMSSLRCHDNAAFTAAMKNPGTRFRAVFIYDPWFESGQKFGLNRWRFLIESLQDLDQSLQAYGTRLYVAKGQPLAVLEKLCSNWNVSSITYQVDKDVNSHLLEESVDALGKELNISVSKFEGHTLYDTKMLLVSHPSLLTFKDFKQILHSIGAPARPTEAPQIPEDTMATYGDDLSLPQEYRIPLLEEVGFSSQESLRTNNLWVGGESVALQRIPEYVSKRMTQSSVFNAETLLDKSSLSPYIRFGCLSVRYFFWTIKDLVADDEKMEEFWKKFASGILSREFFFTVASQVPNFDCYSNNKVCLQLPWDKDVELFEVWRNGKTGFPWIDAAMRQLWKEGWIHHVLRESVATFLTRGDMWISWEYGKKVFWELLLDFETSVSSGCWMKSSGSAFLSGPVEYYCPVTYGIKIDPTGEYIRTYVPELRNFPADYIYCPWMAPVSEQEKAGCRIGTDYPNPIIDHATTGAICSERLRSVMALIHNVNKSEKSSLVPPQLVLPITSQ
uniref:Crypto2_SubDo n=1 Tax=Suberites domuncula TaxID=55567 RepID=A0A1W7M221_SUBDO|nr:Crypto2_SubDo [Suberites domuncula]